MWTEQCVVLNWIYLPHKGRLSGGMRIFKSTGREKNERGVKVIFATFGKVLRLLAVPCFLQRLGFLGNAYCLYWEPVAAKTYML
jgi:hypothetical protein